MRKLLRDILTSAALSLALAGATAAVAHQSLTGAGGRSKLAGGGGGGNDCGGTGTIAFDAGSCQNGCNGFASGSSTATWSHTTAGSNRILIVEPVAYSASLLTVSSVTYNGVALTKLDSVTAAVEGNNQDSEVWYLIAPATGANNIIVTYSGIVDFYDAVAHSYTGTNQSSPINAHAITQNTGGATSISATVTATGGNKCWLAGFAWPRGGTVEAGAATTMRNGAGLAIAGASANADSNATVNSGSRSLVYNSVGGGSQPWLAASALALAPIP